MFALNTQKNDKSPLDTSGVRDFQTDGSNGDRLVFEDPAPQKAVEDAIIRIDEVLTPETPTPQVVVSENPALVQEMAAMRQQLAESNAARDQAISDAVTGLKTAFEERSRELQEAADSAQAELKSLENTAAARQQSLQTLLDTEKARREAMELEMEMAELNSAEAERAEQVARDAAELEKAQVTSPALVFASGNTSNPQTSGSGNSGNSGYLKPFSQWLEDPSVVEIAINVDGQLWIEKSGDAYMSKVEGEFVASQMSKDLAQSIVGDAGAKISKSKPLVSGKIEYKGRPLRIQVAMPPAVEDGASLTIRLFSRAGIPDYKAEYLFGEAVSLDAKRKEKMATVREIAEGDLNEALNKLIEMRLNILVSGGTSTGKHAVFISQPQFALMNRLCELVQQLAFLFYKPCRLIKIGKPVRE